MNVKRLRELISELPDETEIVVEGFDHAYVVVQEARYVDAERVKRQYWEHHGDSNMSPEGTCVKVLRLG